MKIIRTLFILFFITSCNTPRAIYDYDQEVDFSKYSTYAIFPDFRSGLSQLDEGRLLKSLDSAMKKKGFSNAPEDAGLYVNVYTEQFREENPSRLGVGVGGGGRNVGVGVSGGIPLGGTDQFLRITFDFIDAEKDSLVWKAIVETPFDLNASPEQRQAIFDKVVQKALEGYPPKK
ncbi:MAG: DUF4136 domain-containing protein [Salegentibacter sp.]